MPNQELVSYISQLIAKGYPESIIRQTLANSGWKQEPIDEAFHYLRPINPAVSETPPTRKGGILKKVFLALIIVVLLGGLGAGSIFAYSYYNSPERKLNSLVTSLNKIKTMNFDGEVKIDASMGSSVSPLIQSQRNSLPTDPKVLAAQAGSLTLNFDGKVDLNDSKNPKTDLNMKLAGSIFTGGSEVSFELISLEKTFYFNLKNAPIIGFIDLKVFSNQWIKIDQTEADKLAGSQSSAIDVLNQKKLEEAYKKKKIIKKITQLKDEKINDVDTNHFEVTVDRNELVNYLKDSLDLSSNATEAQKDSLAQSFSSLEFTSFEYWIGKKDALPYRLLVGAKSSDPNTQVKVQFLINFKDYNKEVKVEAPTGAKSFDEVLQEYLIKTQSISPEEGDASPFITQSVKPQINKNLTLSQSRDEQRKSDLKQVQYALELYYTDKGAYPAAKNGTISGLLWGSSWSGYLRKVPTDPLSTNSNYCYLSSDPYQYELYAKLENSTDIDYKKPGSLPSCNGVKTYNYQLKSP